MLKQYQKSTVLTKDKEKAANLGVTEATVGAVYEKKIMFES